MTEYDYSPEAYEAYLATQAKISRWVDKTNRLYPYLGNPFTPATPAPHGSDLPRGLETNVLRPSPEKMEDWHRARQREKEKDSRDRERDRDRDRADVYRDMPKEVGRGFEPEKPRDHDRYEDKRRERERERYRDRGPDRELPEYHSDSRSRSHSRQAPIRSKTTPTLPSRAPHTRRASFDQYTYGHPRGEPKRRPSQSRPDVSSSKSKHSSTSPKYDSDGPSSSTRRHFNSSSATHLPNIYPQPSRHRASASAHHLPAPTSAPPFTSHFQYPTPPPTGRQPPRSRTLPPEDRVRGPPWLAPPPLPPPVIPHPVIPTPQGAQVPGFHYRLKGGSAYPIERRVVPIPAQKTLNVLPPPHEKGSENASGGRKAVPAKPQLPLLKRLLTNLTLTRHTGPSPRSPSPETRRWRRRRSF